jgi:hypothetical protein
MQLLTQPLSGGALESAWRRLNLFCWNKNGSTFLDMTKNLREASLVEYLSTTARSLERPESFISLVRRACNAVWIDQQDESPFNSKLVASYCNTLVKKETKRNRNRKGVLPVATFLTRLWVKYGPPTRYNIETLRVVTCIILCLVRMRRISDIFVMDRTKTRIDKDKKFMLIPMRGDKTDIMRNGSTVCIYATVDAHPFNPITLWEMYCRKTAIQEAKYMQSPEYYKLALIQKNAKAKVEVEKMGDTPPMFFHKTNPEIFQQTSMESAIRNLLKELDLQADVLDRKITPGSLRKSARMVAKKAGMEDSLMDAIGGWKQKSVPKDHYEDYCVPRETSDIILRSDIMLEILSRETNKLPLSFKWEDEWIPGISLEGEGPDCAKACKVGNGEATKGFSEDGEGTEVSSDKTMRSKPLPTPPTLRDVTNEEEESEPSVETRQQGDSDRDVTYITVEDTVEEDLEPK